MFVIIETDEDLDFDGYLAKGGILYSIVFINIDIITFETEEKAKTWLNETYMPLKQSKSPTRAKRIKHEIIKLNEKEQKNIFKLKLKG